MRVSTILIGLGLALGVTLSARPVQAQTDDHLKCYKIKDDIKLKGLVDLDGKQFGLEAGCKISKAKLFCVPVTKTVVQVEAKNKDGPVNPLPIFGPPAPGDRLCYKIKCPDSQIPETTVSDQFGTHNLTKFKAFMLCTPAGKFTPPPTPCDLSGAPTCGGVCPDPNQPCRPANDGTTQCLCDEPCGFDAAGVCGGDCAIATDVCQFSTLTNNCDCGPVTQQCTDTTFPNCGGPCPSPRVCLPKLDGTDECDCLDPDVCEFDSQTGICGGPCPNAGDECREHVPGTCDCRPPQAVCDFDPVTEMCGGPCANPTDECTEVAPGLCDCRPPP